MPKPAASADAPSPAAGRSPSGYGLVAGLLVSTAAVLVLVVIGTGAYVTVSMKEGARDDAVRAATMTARTLAPTVAELAKANALSPLRRLLADLASKGDLAEVSVTLPDGQVVAHSEPSRVTVRELPAKWPATLPEELPSSDRVVASETVVIPERGVLILNVRAHTQEAAGRGAMELWYALGGVAVVAASLLLLLFVRMARPLRTLGLIAEALKQQAACGSDLGLLQLDERHGREAQSWNRLLERLGKVPEPSAASLQAAEQRVAAGDESRSSDLEQAANILPIGVIVIDRVGTVRHANNMGAALLGVSPAEITASQLADLLPDEQVIQLQRSVADGLAARRTFEVKRPTPVGEAVLRVQCRPLRKDDYGAALVIIEDVTQQRIADAARNLFIAQATHELRTPLTNMRLSLETILDDEETKVPDVFAPHMNMLQTEVRRLERIISDMLAVSEIEAGSLKLTRGEIQLGRMFEEIEHDHKPLAEKKGLTFKLELPPKLPQVFGDREKLAQALHNLVGNAIKYTPAPGTVSVVISSDDSKLSFAVSDTGLGISKEDQGKLFNRFSRGTDPRVASITGTGLGLALSREIARLHGGDILLESELDKGSTFTLGIPLGRQSGSGNSSLSERKAA